MIYFHLPYKRYLQISFVFVPITLLIIKINNLLHFKVYIEFSILSILFLTQLGLSSNALSEWKKGKAKPSSDAIIKIAEYFNVSADYLLTGKISYNELNKQEQEILCLYRKLPESGKERILGYIDGYLANKKEDE